MEDTLKTRLTEMGLTEEHVEKLATEGVETDAHMARLSADQIKSVTGVGLIKAMDVAESFKPAPSVVEPVAASVANGGDADPVEVEIPEGTKPSDLQLNAAATQLGLDSNILMMMAMGGGVGGLNLADMIEPSRVVPGYRPKIRNFSYIVMDQLQASLGGIPIVVINDDGSVNSDLTTQYILDLQEGNEPAEDNIYYDTNSVPHEIIKVGVDMQSIYDADPVDSSRTLQIRNNMGHGRINWTGVPLDVRQLIWFASTQTRELNPNDDAQLARLRDKVKPGVSRSAFRTDFPKANTAWNEANRTGSLPTLRKQMTTRSARRPALATPRRAGQMRDLSGYSQEDRPEVGTGFRQDHR